MSLTLHVLDAAQNAAALLPAPAPEPAAEEGGGGGSFFSDGRVVALLTLIFSFVLIWVAIGMAGSANKGKFKDQADTTGSVLLACLVGGLGAAGIAISFGGDIFNWLRGI